MCLVGGNLHLFALHFVQHESYLRRFPSDLRSSGSERQMQICLHTLSILTILCCQLLLYTWTNSCYRWHTGLRTAASTRSSRLLGTSAGQCSNAASMHRRRLLASPRLSPCQVKKRNHKKMIGSTGWAVTKSFENCQASLSSRAQNLYPSAKGKVYRVYILHGQVEKVQSNREVQAITLPILRFPTECMMTKGHSSP